jgi:hypothetical protein
MNKSVDRLVQTISQVALPKKTEQEQQTALKPSSRFGKNRSLND